MMNILEKIYVGAEIKTTMVKQHIRKFIGEERGVSNVVATIILLLIVVLIIGIFWDKLQEWLKGMMDTIFGTEINDSGLQ